jgi:cob(I)alamin adenosyltransferase
MCTAPLRAPILRAVFLNILVAIDDSAHAARALDEALDLARAVVRRAERSSVAAARAGWLEGSNVVPYLNRLADLVYTLARWQEGAWRPVRVEPQP